MFSDKHDDLLQQKAKLDEFKISHDSSNCKLELTDGNTRNFRSFDPVAISKMIEFCKESIDVKIAEIENQLNF